jgi:hypothetical protein
MRTASDPGQVRDEPRTDLPMTVLVDWLGPAGIVTGALQDQGRARHRHPDLRTGTCSTTSLSDGSISSVMSSG